MAAQQPAEGGAVKTPLPEDPPRWRRAAPSRRGVEAPAAGASGDGDGDWSTAEIGAALGRIPAPEPFDDLRLEQLRQRIRRRARRAAPARAAARLSAARRMWLRACALALASFVLGGLALAALQHFVARRPAVPAPVASAPPAARAPARPRAGVRAAGPPPVAVDRASPAAPTVGATDRRPLPAPLAVPRAPRPPRAVSARASSSAPALTPAPASSEARALNDAAISGVTLRPAPPAAPLLAPPPVEDAPLAPSVGAARAGATSGAGPWPPSSRPPSAPPAPPLAHAERETAEAALLASALRALRAERDPRAALTALDRRDREFPRGLLDREAALARVEALMALGQSGNALAILDRLRLSDRETDRRVSVLRAELRARGRRCADAIADFDAALGGAGDDDVAARALYGRALCRGRVGDAAGARHDLVDYLSRFPAGADRDAAVRALDRLSRDSD
jgi:hypothetical protein